VTLLESLELTAKYLEEGHGSFGRDRAASLRAHAERIRTALASVNGAWDLSDENITRGNLLQHINGPVTR